MFETAPPELLLALKEVYRLDFIPIPFKERNEFEAALLALHPGLGAWVDEIWEEYRDYDCILAHDGQGNIHRFIRTVTLLVVRDRPLKNGRMVREHLRETIEWPDGSRTERRYNNSLSEKWKWRIGGSWIVLPRNWRNVIRRAVLEELGIRLTHRFLRAPWIIRFGSSVHYYKDPMATMSGSVEVKTDDPKRPHVTTHNLLFHFFLKLHEMFWKQSYREEKWRAGHLVKTMVNSWSPTSLSLGQQAKQKEKLND
jgi:hypothetical protein